jgi:hypothetical protein
MSARLGTVWYWLGVGIAAALVVAAVLWNAWTFNQYRVVQRQIESLGLDAAPAGASGNGPTAGSPQIAEIELLLEADRRGILDENFEALLTEPQKRALGRARRGRLADKASNRNTSLIFGVVLILGGILAYGVGRTARRRAR